jgi:hypothetical protein
MSAFVFKDTAEMTVASVRLHQMAFVVTKETTASTVFLATEASLDQPDLPAQKE